MPIAHAVMGLLARGERHGYELRRELEAELGPEWRIDFGQLYRVLASMTRKGWVGVRVEPGGQGPDRKVYAITRRGRLEFERWLRQPITPPVPGRDEIAVRLRLGSARDRARLGRLVADCRRAFEAECGAHVGVSGAARPRDAGRWLLAEGRRRRAEAALAWLRSCEAVISQPHRPVRPRSEPGPLIAIGSDDPVLDLFVRRTAELHPEMRLYARPAGSIAGLVALRERRAHLAGIHLLDADSGEYNVPFVKHVLPDEPMVLIHLARREQGLMVAAGNPKAIRRLRDLTRPGVRLINRQRGAGTRLLLHHRLCQAKIDPRMLVGYEREAPTHNAVAAAVAGGAADAGPGIRAVAEAWGLEFIPLSEERYDLAIPRAVFDSRRLRPLLEVMHQESFRREAAAFSGYDVSHMGEIAADIQ